MDISNIKDKIKSKSKTYYGSIVKTAQDDSISNETAFYFDVITEHSITVSNNITDNYLENNTAIQDTIAHSPITITLNGMVSELVYVPSTNNPRFLSRAYDFINNKNGQVRDYVVTNKLSIIGQLYPPVDNLTQLAKNAVVYVEDTIDRYRKIFKNLTKNMNDRTRLEDVFSKLMVLREGNKEMIVTTPFKTYQNMYIQNIQFTQGNENHVGSISLTLKQLNFTDIKYTEADKDVLAKYNSYAQAETENNGKADGTIQNDSEIGKLIYKWTGKEPYRLNK